MLLTFRRRKDKARDDIKIFFFFSLLLLIEMMIAAVLSLLLLLLLSLSLSVCENNNTECVSFVFCCCLTSFTVWESSRPSFLFFSFWVSLKIKGKKTPLQCFFFVFFSFFSSASLWGHKKKKKRELSEITPLKIYYFKALSTYAHFHNT